MTVLEFLSVKLWFWLAVAAILAVLLAASFYGCVIKNWSGKKELLLVKIPAFFCVFFWAIFLVSVLLRAWGV